MPCTSTTCRPVRGPRATATDVLGQLIRRTPSSSTAITGRFTWKSWYSSGSSSSTCWASQACWRWVSASVAAEPASFQPSNAASMTVSSPGRSAVTSLTPTA
jgi:hypothetical protein